MPFGGGRFKSVELDPLTIWNIFYYFFRNVLHGGADEKVDLENKERPNMHYMNHTCEWYNLVLSLFF